MGMHSLVTSELARTTTISGTVVLGFYNARPIFFELMLTKVKLEEKKSFTLPLVTPAGLTPGVHYQARTPATSAAEPTTAKANGPDDW
jgi:hypothetical protein